MSKGTPPDGIRLATTLVTAGRRREWTGFAVNPPVVHASTVLFDSVAALAEASKRPNDVPYYGRRGTPTQWALADALTALDPGAAGTMLYPSGAAAIAAALLAVVRPGDRLLMVDSAYQPTRQICDGLLKTIGVETVYYDPLIGAGIEALVTPATRAIFLESPGSLTFEVQDVPAIVAVAKRHGLVTLIDNTWATPLLLPTMALGIDLSIMACTKYIVGHSDAMLGSVTVAADWLEPLRRISGQLGYCVAPDDAFLGSRGLRTLGVRLRTHQENGLAVARWLAERPEVARVLHPGLAGAPGHDLWARDFKGASGLFAIELVDAVDRAGRERFVDALALFGLGFSWGGFESLALPVDPASCRSATTWDGGLLVRLHIGLEDPADLIADLAQAFSTI